MKFFESKFFHKFSFIVTIIIILGFITFSGIGVFYFYNAKSYVFNLTAKTLGQSADNYYSKLNKRIDTAEFYLKLAAKHHKNFENILPFLNDRHTYKHVFYLNKKGKVIQSTSPNFSTQAFKNQLSKDIFVAVKSVGGADVALAVPIKADSLWIGGVVSLEISLFQKNESFFLYNPQNLLIYSSGKHLPFEKTFKGKLVESTYGNIILSKDKKFFGKHVNLKHGFSVNIVQSSLLAYARLHKLVKENLLFFTLIYIIIAFIVLFLVKKLIKSIQKANKSLEEANLLMEDRIKQRTKELEELNSSLIEEINRRIQTEKWLAESQQRYKLALAATNEGNWEYFPKTEICYFSERWFALIGYTSNELPHNFKTWLSLMHPDDRKNFKDKISKAILDGLGFEIQYRLKSKDNTWVWISNKGICAKDDEDNIESLKLVGTHSDITARKKAEEALKESQERFALFMDFLPALVYIKEADSSLVYVNRHMQSFLGTSTWNGKYPEDIYLPDVASKVKSEDLKALRDGVIKDVISEYTSFGSKRIYQTHKFAIKRSGKPNLIGGISLDITEKQEAEEARVMLETAIQQATETVIITDVLDKITYVNSAFEKATGFLKDEVIGKTPASVIGSHLKPKFWKEVWEVISSGKTYKGIISTKCKNNAIIEEETTITPVKNHFEAITNFVYLKRNISEKQKLEERLRKAQKLEAIGTLAGGVAHDFNNILAIIAGFTELIQIRTSNEKNIDEPLDEIQVAAKRAKKLISQILTFSSGSQQQKVIKPLQISSLIEEYIPMLKATIPTSIKIVTNVEETKQISADPTEINQIFINLCTNAYQAIGDVGTITITVKDVLKSELNKETAKMLDMQNYSLLKISDDGIGILPENVSKIFDPYFTTKPQGSGTGLGLSIIHGIIKGYNGYIEVKSKKNKGTSFYVYLPHSKQINVPIKKEKAPKIEPKKTSKQINILLVDDEEAITRFNSRALMVYGYNVNSFNDSVDAYNEFLNNTNKYDLLITDMTMPKMTGAELARKIIQQKPEIPIIMMTGYSEFITPDEAKFIGIKEFVYKPVMVKQLVELIEKNIKDC